MTVAGFDDPEDLEWSDVPTLDVEVTGPQVLGYLLGPDGQPMATLVDRPIITFGFSR